MGGETLRLLLPYYKVKLMLRSGEYRVHYSEASLISLLPPTRRLALVTPRIETARRFDTEGFLRVEPVSAGELEDLLNESIEASYSLCAEGSAFDLGGLRGILRTIVTALLFGARKAQGGVKATPVLEARLAVEYFESVLGGDSSSRFYVAGAPFWRPYRFGPGNTVYRVDPGGRLIEDRVLERILADTPDLLGKLLERRSGSPINT